jgi:glycosyltransferase involved in cell wall biosynthesis
MSGYILLTRISGLFSLPQIVTIHGIPFFEAKQKNNLKDKMVYYTNGIVELLLCPRNIIHISKYSVEKSKQIKNKKYTIIPNAVSPDFFTIPFKNKTSNKLLYVGSIETRKNLVFILKALKILVDKKLFFSLEVLGGFSDEVYKKEVLTFIKENQLEEYVTLYGWQTQQKLQQVLAQSDILIMSSKQETLPMVIAEAMSAGKVVVSSTVGGIPEMVKHEEDGFLFELSSVNNAVSILENLYNNDILMKQIQTKARKRAIETYHCDKVAQKTISFYKSI